MKLSLVISSYNQKTRLKYCLQSALDQKLNYASDLEIIVADDNSEDGTDDLLKLFPAIKIVKSEFSKKEKYTLAANWNTAVFKHASGDRIIFTNGDHIFDCNFADAHADPIMSDHIVFGPALQTTSSIEQLLDSPFLDYKKIRTVCEHLNWLNPDRHHNKAADSYNVEWSANEPYGYNFSVCRKHFLGVGGFPHFEKWGEKKLRYAKK